MRENNFLVLLLLLLIPEVEGQEIPLGTWRSHLNYSNSQIIVEYSGKVYVASQSGFFYLGLQDNSINKLTKNDGFGDVGITAMATTPDSEKLIIGYSSGFIDILDGNKIYNINTIKEITEYTEKKINDILFYNDLAYLVTDFGLIALDYGVGEVIESYANLGENGTRLGASDAAILADSIYLATTEGIICTNLSPSNNPMDFNNWKRFKGRENYPDADVESIATFNHKIYAGFRDQGLFFYENNSWIELDFPPLAQFKKLKVEESALYVITQGQNTGKIYVVNAQDQYTQLSDDHYNAPSDLILMENGAIWAADQKLGLVVDITGSGENIYPEGPVSDNLIKLTYFEEKIAGIEKGIDADFNELKNPAYFSVFEEGRWQNYTDENTASLMGISDFTDIAYNPQMDGLYLSTFGQGIFKFSNSSMEFTPLGVNGESPFQTKKVTSIASNETGTLWAIEYGSPDKLYSLIGDVWRGLSLSSGSHALEILSIPAESTWLRLEKGLLAVEPLTGTPITLSLNDGNLINSVVTDMAVCQNGFIWYGTPSGVAYISNPWEVFEGEATSIIPVFEDDDLLKNQHIQVIEIDPANRKWVSTPEGAWLFSEDADSLIYHFTEENSPLTSNTIWDIEINPNSGEVFFATSKGLVSYRGHATEGEPTHDQVKIFPNPVKPGYTGTIGISGVVEGAIVKITDLSGNLVKEMHAVGGTATWDGTTLSGSRAKSGIYLVFSASSDGEEAFLGKLAFFK